MSVFRAMVTLNPAAEPASRFVNTWHFLTGTGTDVIAASSPAKAALDAFYQAIDAQLSSLCSAAVPEVRWYDLTEPKPRVPFWSTTLTQLLTAANTAPAELAVCLSYRANYTSGTSSRRRRGRIYLGPFQSGLCNSSTGRVDASIKTVLVNAAQVFLDASQASALYKWGVYSRMDDPGEEGLLGGREVVQAWIDDAVDIQRRRGLSSGTRSYVL